MIAALVHRGAEYVQLCALALNVGSRNAPIFPESRADWTRPGHRKNAAHDPERLSAGNNAAPYYWSALGRRSCPLASLALPARCADG